MIVWFKILLVGLMFQTCLMAAVQFKLKILIFNFRTLILVFIWIQSLYSSNSFHDAVWWLGQYVIISVKKIIICNDVTELFTYLLPFWSHDLFLLLLCLVLSLCAVIIIAECSTLYSRSPFIFNLFHSLTTLNRYATCNFHFWNRILLKYY